MREYRRDSLVRSVCERRASLRDFNCERAGVGERKQAKKRACMRARGSAGYPRGIGGGGTWVFRVVHTLVIKI